MCQAPSRHLLLSQPLGQGSEQGVPRAQVQGVCRARTPDSGQDRERQGSPHLPQQSHPESANERQNPPHSAPHLWKQGLWGPASPALKGSPLPRPVDRQEVKLEHSQGQGVFTAPPSRGGRLRVEFSMTLQHPSSGGGRGLAGPGARAAANWRCRFYFCSSPNEVTRSQLASSAAQGLAARTWTGTARWLPAQEGEILQDLGLQGPKPGYRRRAGRWRGWGGPQEQRSLGACSVGQVSG